MLVFEEGGKTGGHGEKTLGARTRTNNNLNPHLTAPGPGIEPGPHWWGAPSPLPYILDNKVHLPLYWTTKYFRFYNFQSG